MTLRSLILFFLLPAALLIKAAASRILIEKQASSQNKNEEIQDSVTFLLQQGKQFLQLQPDTAAFYYEKAYQLALRNNDQDGISKYISYAVVLLNNEGKYDSALSLGNKMINIGKTLKDTAILIKGYNDAANEYEYMGELQEASENYTTALKLADIINNPKMQLKLNNNLASVFIELKEYKQANVYASKAYEMAETIKDTAEMGSSLINLGITEMHISKNSLAMKHFNETIKISNEVHDVTLAGDARLNEGDIYTNENKFKIAQYEYEQVYSMAKKLGMPYYKLYSLFSLANMYNQKNDLDRAIDYTKQAIAIGKKLGAKDELTEMYNTLSVLLEKKGNTKDALTYRKKYEALNDSIMSAQVKTNISRLQIQYKTAKQDKQIAEQNLLLEKNHSTIQRKNTLLLFSVIGIIILLLLIIVGYRFYRQRQKLQEQTLLNFQKEHEVIRLKAEMQGREEERSRISGEIHDDIGSALTTIMYLSNNLNEKDGKVKTQIANKINATAGEVVDKMNEIIWSMNKNFDTVDDLLTYIRYHAVELLDSRGICHQFNLPAEIPQLTLSGEQRRNIYLVIKEALHNIIKHAEAKKVTFGFEICSELSIIIHDDGKGIDDNEKSKFGNGLRNMQRRMETLGGTFTISSHEGTTVKITLSLQTQFL
jgi:signal transduction histidine kinase